MKKNIFIATFFLISGLCSAQEWFTSLEVAKRLALVQDKMLFVLWEGSLEEEYPVILFDENGTASLVDLRENEFISQMIWEYFVPVKLPEFMYAEISNKVKETRGPTYYNRLIDDEIKIMDVNGNILNTDDDITKFYNINYYLYLGISEFIKRYALNTSYLKQDLENYAQEKNFVTSFRLATKYVDYAIFVTKELRPYVMDLANIYFDQAKKYLDEEGNAEAIGFTQKIELFKLQEDLILNNAKKVRRQLKKMDVEEIDDMNQSLFEFLNYTVYLLLKDEKNAVQWRDKMTSFDMKKAQLILNINSETDGKDN